MVNCRAAVVAVAKDLDQAFWQTPVRGFVEELVSQISKKKLAVLIVLNILIKKVKFSRTLFIYFPIFYLVMVKENVLGRNKERDEFDALAVLV